MIVRLALVAAVGLALAGPVHADDPPTPGLEPKAEAALRKDLESRARQYANARAALRAVCGQCGGKGAYPEIRGRVQRIVQCGVCDRKGWVIHRQNFRTVHYEMKSPAFRLLPTAQDKVEAAYKAARASAEPPKNFRSSKVADLVLADATHGVTRITFDGQLEESVRWVLAEKKWWVWDAAADGAWPDPPPAADKGPAAFAAGSPLLPAEDALVFNAVSGITGRRHDLATATQRDNALILVFDVRPPVGAGVRLSDLAVEDFRLLAKAIWVNPQATWGEIRWTMRAKYRDKFGAVEMQPYLRARITREDFGRIQWENLAPTEALALFAPETPTNDGWTIWRQE